MIRSLKLTAGPLALLFVAIAPAHADDACYPSPKGEPCKVLYKDVSGGKLAPGVSLVDDMGAAIYPATKANQTAANAKLDTLISNTAQVAVTETVNYINASAVAATQTGADVTETGLYRGLIVYLDISSISGATVTCTLSQKTPGGSYISILAGAGETAAVSRAYAIYPGFTAVTNSKADYVLTKKWRVACVVSGGTASFTVGYQRFP